MSVNIGITGEKRKVIAERLSKLLADTYTLYVKTHNFHWNVTGPHFHSLHQMFEEHYQALAGAVDEIAERIRALGHFAPGSYAQFSELTDIKEATSVPDYQEMVRQLCEDHETVIRSARASLPEVSDAADEADTDLITARLEYHEKTAWMLRSMVEAE
jgi:starvation-inducible DNA-binding protein